MCLSQAGAARYTSLSCECAGSWCCMVGHAGLGVSCPARRHMIGTEACPAHTARCLLLPVPSFAVYLTHMRIHAATLTLPVYNNWTLSTVVLRCRWSRTAWVGLLLGLPILSCSPEPRQVPVMGAALQPLVPGACFRRRLGRSRCTELSHISMLLFVGTVDVSCLHGQNIVTASLKTCSCRVVSWTCKLTNMEQHGVLRSCVLPPHGSLVPFSQ